MKIKILKPSDWYKHFVGSEFEVDYYEEISSTNLRFRVENNGWVYNDHCVITELPESFCVKRCDDGIKWGKYIDWLNKKCGNILNGFSCKYYGVHKTTVCGNDGGCFGIEIHIDDMIKHIDYMESQQHIKGGEQFHKESQLTVKMNTQKLSRQGLKEIHSVACSQWKQTLEQYGSRNPLEDYIELTQEEVNKMFLACTKEQLPIVSKYLKKEDGSVDLSKVKFDKSGILINDEYILRINDIGGDDKSFLLISDYDWSIKIVENKQRLYPTKKK